MSGAKGRVCLGPLKKDQLQKNIVWYKQVKYPEGDLLYRLLLNRIVD